MILAKIYISVICTHMVNSRSHRPGHIYIKASSSYHDSEYSYYHNNHSALLTIHLDIELIFLQTQSNNQEADDIHKFIASHISQSNKP